MALLVPIATSDHMLTSLTDHSWHPPTRPCPPGMERAMAMRDARAGHVPSSMARRFPHESRLVMACMQPQPHLRPTAVQLLAMLDVVWPTTDPAARAPASSSGGAAAPMRAVRAGSESYSAVRQGGQGHARASSLGSLAFEGVGVANGAARAKAGAVVEVVEERGGIATPRERMQGGVVGGGKAGSLSTVAPPPAVMLLPPVSEGSGPSGGASTSGGSAVTAGAARVARAPNAVPIRQIAYDTSSSADSLPAARNASAFCGAASVAAAVELGVPVATPKVPLPPGWLGVTSANSNPLPLRQQQQRRVSPCTAVLLEDRAVQTDVTWLYGSAPRSVYSSSSPQAVAAGAVEVVRGPGKEGALGSQGACGEPGPQQEQEQQAMQGADHHSSVHKGSSCVLHMEIGVAADGVGSGADGPGGGDAELGEYGAVLRLKDAEIARLRALLAEHGVVHE